MARHLRTMPLVELQLGPMHLATYRLRSAPVVRCCKTRRARQLDSAAQQLLQFERKPPSC
jgi:hypothetical protein